MKNWGKGSVIPKAPTGGAEEAYRPRHCDSRDWLLGIELDFCLIVHMRVLLCVGREIKRVFTYIYLFIQEYIS